MVRGLPAQPTISKVLFNFKQHSPVFSYSDNAGNLIIDRFGRRRKTGPGKIDKSTEELYN